MQLPNMHEIEAAQKLVYTAMPPTPQYSWPRLNERFGLDGSFQAWVKHENHTPTGAFKLRGALVYVTWLQQTQPGLATVVAATSGNFGQGVAMAAHLLGLRSVIIVPEGTGCNKKLAISAHGANVMEQGRDFEKSLEFARIYAAKPGHCMAESMHPRLLMGTATYALEFFRAAPALDRVYVPVGLGSSICGIAAVKHLLSLETEIIGVVADSAPCYALSFTQKRVVEAPSLTQLADGLASRIPNADAMSIIWEHAARFVQVSDAQIAQAIRAYFEDTHNLVEGAAAAALAGALLERDQLPGKRIGIVCTGGNIDRQLYTQVLEGKF